MTASPTSPRSPGTKARSRSALERAAILLGAVGVAFATAQAPASASPGQCADNRLCAWSDDNYGGIFTAYTASARALGGDNDRFDSLWNRDSVSWYVYVDAYNQGAKYCVRPGYSVSKLGDWFDLHDRISAVQKLGTVSCGAATSIGSYKGSWGERLPGAGDPAARGTGPARVLEFGADTGRPGRAGPVNTTGRRGRGAGPGAGRCYLVHAW
ncbi:peptidase inhibitor family I36 protein [Streptomyces sp. HMX112]|uniref:peptidase inhibitor family I36 protein n=1 Tax=Streptomyces sp. HMX112 TaxID=3390850 RepID=UPI003A809E94